MIARLVSLIPLTFVDTASRAAGFLAQILRPGQAFAAERRFRGVYWGLRLGTKGLSIGSNVQIESPHLTTLGQGVKIYCSTHLNAGASGRVHIGRNTHIGRFNNLSGAGGLTIGDRCAISSHVAIYTVANDPQTPQPALAPTIQSAVTIGNDVFIGAGVRIVPGVTIGDGAVLGAGAVVTADIPAHAIAAGVPAKVLRYKEPPEA